MSDNLGHKLHQESSAPINQPAPAAPLSYPPDNERLQAQGLNRQKNQLRNQQKNEQQNTATSNNEQSDNIDRKTAVGESLRYLGIGLKGGQNNSQATNEIANGARNLESKIDGHNSKKQAERVIKSQNHARNKKGSNSADKTETDPIGEAIFKSTKGMLDSLWSSVWFDYTFLSLLGLNAYFFASKLIPQMAQFGDDDRIGILLGGGTIAKEGKKLGIESSTALPRIVEIMILIFADLIILAILLAIGYILYKMANLSLWKKIEGVIRFIIGDIGGIANMLLK